MRSSAVFSDTEALSFVEGFESMAVIVQRSPLLAARLCRPVPTL
jgi:hypothetical protein